MAAAPLPDFISPVAEATDQHGLFALVYGPSGAGKTTLASTTPDPARTLVLSAEQGLLSIRNSGVKCAQIKDIEGFRKIYRWLVKGQENFDWIVLDSVSEIAEVVLQNELATNRDGRKAYGEMATKMINILKQLRDLPLNVLVIAAVKSKEDNGMQVRVPDTPGSKLADKLPYLFDEVFYLHTKRGEDGQIERRLITQGVDKLIAKDRSGKLDPSEPPNLTEIHNKIYC